MTPERKAKLFAAPLRELKREHLEVFTRKALLTWGDSNDLRHFLPRMFELVATSGRFGFVEPEITLGKLKLAEWNQWPVHERESIQRFLEAFWRDTIQSDHAGPDSIEVNSCLCAISRAVDDVQPFLDLWEKEMSPTAAGRFVELVWDCLSNTKISGVWWKDYPKQAAKVARWILSPERIKMLEAVFFQLNDSEENRANEISAAILHLEIVGKPVGG